MILEQGVILEQGAVDDTDVILELGAVADVILEQGAPDDAGAQCPRAQRAGGRRALRARLSG